MIVINGKKYNVVEASFGENGEIVIEGPHETLANLLQYLQTVISVGVAPNYAIGYFVYDVKMQKIYGNYYRITLYLTRM